MIDPREAQRYFEDVSVGDEFDESRTPTTERVIAFIAAELQPGTTRNRGGGRFTDLAAARRDGLERPIVPGTMSSAMITSLVADWMGPFGRLVSLDISYRRPILHGDVVRCVAVVTDLAGDEDALEPVTAGIVSLDVHLEGEDGERPVQGTAVVELPRRMD